MKIKNTAAGFVIVAAIIVGALGAYKFHAYSATWREQKRADDDAFWGGRVVARICGNVIIYRLRDGSHVLGSRTTNPDRVENIATVCGGIK